MSSIAMLLTAGHRHLASCLPRHSTRVCGLMSQQQPSGTTTARHRHEDHSSITTPKITTSVTEDITVNTISGTAMESFNRLFRHQRIQRKANTDETRSMVLFKRKVIPQLFHSFEERLKEMDPKERDPERHMSINIGFSPMSTEKVAVKRKRQNAVLRALRQDKQIIKQARDHKLRLDVQQIQAEYRTDAAPAHSRTLAQHCGIFRDIFGPCAHFDIITPFRVEHDYDEDYVSVVHRGNIIKPREAASAPSVSYNSPDDALWTLQLTNPDGDLYKKDSECLHWLVANIKGSDLSTGDVLAPYLPPVPPRGVGYQRMVFILYRQMERLTDLDNFNIQDPLLLRSRSFCTLDFFKPRQSLMTPAGLCWYNTDWDTSLISYYHTVLGMKEPIFEYEFPKPYMKPQMRGPIRKNFTFYMDRFRTKEDLGQEMLLKRLRRLNPFKPDPAQLPYPNVAPINHLLPSWQRQEIKLERNAFGKYRDLYQQTYQRPAMADKQLLREAGVVEVEKRHGLRMGSKWINPYAGLRTLKARETAAANEQAKAEKAAAIVKIVDNFST